MSDDSDDVAKITFRASELYIIRATATFVDGKVQVNYYMSPSMWTFAPVHATIFQYDAAEAHLHMYHRRDKAEHGWADNRKEVFDIVPLYGEILNSPNGKTLTVKKNKGK